ncbi:MAG: winged helix-turn-helix transcriptional regulator [Candidatus Sungbacteria bacterium]|nr:winged helix-turn-helix transcriptional regulator [Candidatus Sungbacteria bacterium]
MKELGLERSLKALANRRRIGILRHLKRVGEAPVGEIAAAIHLSLKATSKHLGILTANDIVSRDQRGLQMFYSLTPNPKPPVKYITHLL